MKPLLSIFDSFAPKSVRQRIHALIPIHLKIIVDEIEATAGDYYRAGYSFHGFTREKYINFVLVRWIVHSSRIGLVHIRPDDNSKIDRIMRIFSEPIFLQVTALEIREEADCIARQFASFDSLEVLNR